MTGIRLLAQFVAILLSLIPPPTLVNMAAAQVILPSKSNIDKNSDALIVLVRSLQRQHVKESYGERAFECFTDVDLEKFHDANIPKKVSAQLRTDKQFLSIVNGLQSLNTKQRSELLERVALTYKPTWSQLGKIDKRGQTDAGQLAEREIAEAIARVVKETL